MKKLLVVSAVAALGLSTVAVAGGLPEEMPMAPAAYSSDAGVYIGLSGGFGITNWKNLVPSSTKVEKDNGAIGRAFLGYDINRYFAVEAGYTYFFNKPEVGGNKIDRTHAVDLMAKIKAPVVDNFDLYAKLGANYLMTKAGDDNKSNINVAYGAGADYYITPNIVANVEWLRLNGNAEINSKDVQPHADAFLVGLRYRADI